MGTVGPKWWDIIETNTEAWKNISGDKQWLAVCAVAWAHCRDLVSFWIAQKEPGGADIEWAVTQLNEIYLTGT